MIRGTTPTHIFKTNVDLTGARVYITYAQDKKPVLEKTGEDVTITSKSVSVTLSQRETFKFRSCKDVDIQIRYIFPDGSAGASNIMTVDVSDVLKEGVIEP